MQRFQFQSLDHISAFPKPEKHLIAFFYAFGSQADPMIQICQFIHPFLPGLTLLELLENRNPLFHAHILSLVKSVLQYISAGILRRYLYKFLIIFNRLHILFHLDGKLTQRIYDQSACRVFLISQKKNILTLLVSSVDLV